VRAKASAEVYNLKTLEDFPGTYMAEHRRHMQWPARAPRHAEPKRVVVHLFTTTEGLNLKLAPGRYPLYFK